MFLETCLGQTPWWHLKASTIKLGSNLLLDAFVLHIMPITLEAGFMW